jgi:hypothetical protein
LHYIKETRGVCPVSNEGKKMFDLTKEDLKFATEVKEAIEDALLDKHPYVMFEHVLLWWLTCPPAES